MKRFFAGKPRYYKRVAKVSLDKVHGAIVHAARNGVKLESISSLSHLLRVEDLVLALARGASSNAVVEHWRAVDREQAAVGALVEENLALKAEVIALKNSDASTFETALSQTALAYKLANDVVSLKKELKVALTLAKMTQTARDEVLALKKQLELVKKHSNEWVDHREAVRAKEVATLKEELKTAKAQYSKWADETEADHAKEVASLKAELKMLKSDVSVLVNRVAAEQIKRKAAQEESHELWAQIKDLKEQYAEWNKGAEADHAKAVATLKTAKKEIEIYMALLNDAEKKADAEISALKTLLNAERLKNANALQLLDMPIADELGSFEPLLFLEM